MVRLTGEMYLKYFLEWRGRTCFIAKYYYVFMLLILFGRLCGTQPIVEVEREGERVTGDQLLLRIIQYVKHFNCWERGGRGRQVSPVMTVFIYKH